MQWIKLTDRMPNPDEHDRVLIYTEGSDFNGEQVFDVKAETLNECFYADPEDQPEVCKHATHWAVHPRDAALHPTRQQGDADAAPLSESGHYLITPRNGGKPYTSTAAPDSWELRECDIRWVSEAPSLQEMP